MKMFNLQEDNSEHVLKLNYVYKLPAVNSVLVDAEPAADLQTAESAGEKYEKFNESHLVSSFYNKSFCVDENSTESENDTPLAKKVTKEKLTALINPIEFANKTSQTMATVTKAQAPPVMSQAFEPPDTITMGKASGKFTIHPISTKFRMVKTGEIGGHKPTGVVTDEAKPQTPTLPKTTSYIGAGSKQYGDKSMSVEMDKKASSPALLQSPQHEHQPKHSSTTHGRNRSPSYFRERSSDTYRPRQRRLSGSIRGMGMSPPRDMTCRKRAPEGPRTDMIMIHPVVHQNITKIDKARSSHMFFFRRG